MALFKWIDDYSVGVSSIDNQHKKLFGIMNKLHDGMKEGIGEKAIGAIIKELLDYTVYHFSEEEKKMESINYAGLPTQLRAHKAFISKIEEYKQEADKGNAIFVCTKVSRTAVDWLKEHILKIDKKYEKAMAEGNIH